MQAGVQTAFSSHNIIYTYALPFKVHLWFIRTSQRISSAEPWKYFSNQKKTWFEFSLVYDVFVLNQISEFKKKIILST